MSRLAIAMDLGTSGFRAQVLDLASGKIISTAITNNHPLPGDNVMDHLHFALDLGVEIAQRIVIRAINRVISNLHVPTDQVVRFGVCGNPIQLSLFQGIEIRDLAFAGSKKLASLAVTPPTRDAAVVSARSIAGLKLPGRCEVIIPPAVRHEVGADTLAMIMKSGMLERDESSLATDFGTNAEVALFHEGKVFTGSTAAGPVLEGRRISCGMLAVPGVISDLVREGRHYRLIMLDNEMRPIQGGLVDLGKTGFIDQSGAPVPIGITGTGTLAAINLALEGGLIKLPHITTADGKLHLGDKLFLTEDDLLEAGKAIGAVRAGHMTLCREADIGPEVVRTSYMSGASGTYMDAIKAQQLGLIPPCVKTVHQVGNTSLATARDLVTDTQHTLDRMTALAERFRQSHCMFASSKTFQKIYILELSYWTEGMPITLYSSFLRKYGLPEWPQIEGTPEIVRAGQRDIDDLGKMGLTTIFDIGRVVKMVVDGCDSCMTCIRECPGRAISMATDTDIQPAMLALNESRCNGVACRRCERVCPIKVFQLERFFRLMKDERV